MLDLPKFLRDFFAPFSFEFLVNLTNSSSASEVDPSFVNADQLLVSFPFQILKKQRTALKSLLDLAVRKGMDFVLLLEDTLQILVDNTVNCRLRHFEILRHIPALQWISSSGSLLDFGSQRPISNLRCPRVRQPFHRLRFT